MILSIVVVCLNAGSALDKTVKSIMVQDSNEYEVIVKDGGSTDGSVGQLPDDPRIRLVRQRDCGIYDAMNQAIEFLTGEYVLFMNCGDTFFSTRNISEILDFVQKCGQQRTIYYGDCYTVNRKAIIHYPDNFDDYICFSKTLCHQATIFPAELLKRRRYQTQYRICGDFELYVYAYCNGYSLVHLPTVIANYEGNGASESLANRKRAVIEKDEILRRYFTANTYRKNWIKLQLHGKGIRQWMAQSKYFYKAYSCLAGIVYNLSDCIRSKKIR